MIIRQKRTKNFTVLNNGVIDDTSLDWNSLGLLTYLLSRPDHWEVHTSQLVKLRRAGRDAVLVMLKQLRAAGYVVMQRQNSGHVNWLVYDEPQPIEKQPKTGFPIEGKSPDGKIPQRENPAVLVNTDLLSVKTDFLYFWDSYDLKKSRSAAERQWHQLSDGDRVAAVLAVEKFKKSLPGWNSLPYPSTYLRDRRWLDDLTPPRRVKKESDRRKRSGMPFDDVQLPSWAAELGYPKPNVGETYRQYRARLTDLHKKCEN